MDSEVEFDSLGLKLVALLLLLVLVLATSRSCLLASTPPPEPTFWAGNLTTSAVMLSLLPMLKHRSRT